MVVNHRKTDVIGDILGHGKNQPHLSDTRTGEGEQGNGIYEQEFAGNSTLATTKTARTKRSAALTGASRLPRLNYCRIGRTINSA